MNNHKPEWYARLRKGPFEKVIFDSKMQQEVELRMKTAWAKNPKRRLNPWAAAVVATVFLFIAITLVPWMSAIIKETDITMATPYEGIEKNDVLDLSKATNIEEYKGNNDNWAAVYYIYKMKDDNNQQQKKLYIKYVGKKPNPIGEISYAYDLGGKDVGSGAMTFNNEPDNGIYYLGPLAKNETVHEKDSTLKLQIIWNGNKLSELIELKP